MSLTQTSKTRTNGILTTHWVDDSVGHISLTDARPGVFSMIDLFDPETFGTLRVKASGLREAIDKAEAMLVSGDACHKR